MAFQKYQEILEISLVSPIDPVLYDEAKQKRDAAKRKLRKLREFHEEAARLAAKQNNRNLFKEESLRTLNLIDPETDMVDYQKWVDKLEKVGVTDSQIPLLLQRLRVGQ